MSSGITGKDKAPAYAFDWVANANDHDVGGYKDVVESKKSSSCELGVWLNKDAIAELAESNPGLQ
jgi:hypothetical protein